MIWIPNGKVELVSFSIKDQESFVFFLILQDDEFRYINEWRIIDWFDDDLNFQIIVSISINGGNCNSISSIEVLFSVL